MRHRIKILTPSQRDEINALVAKGIKVPMQLVIAANPAPSAGGLEAQLRRMKSLRYLTTDKLRTPVD